MGLFDKPAASVTVTPEPNQEQSLLTLEPGVG